MEQRSTWMCYLLIGISTIFTLAISCESRTEYRVDADIVFINETEYFMNYSGLFELPSKTTHTERIVGVGGEDTNSENCCQGALESFQGAYNQVYLILDDSLCVLYTENQGPTAISNFEAILLGDDHYQFTYTFTNDNLTNIITCE